LVNRYLLFQYSVSLVNRYLLFQYSVSLVNRYMFGYWFTIGDQ